MGYHPVRKASIQQRMEDAWQPTGSDGMGERGPQRPGEIRIRRSQGGHARQSPPGFARQLLLALRACVRVPCGDLAPLARDRPRRHHCGGRWDCGQSSGGGSHPRVRGRLAHGARRASLGDHRSTSEGSRRIRGRGAHTLFAKAAGRQRRSVAGSRNARSHHELGFSRVCALVDRSGRRDSERGRERLGATRTREAQAIFRGGPRATSSAANAAPTTQAMTRVTLTYPRPSRRRTSRRVRGRPCRSLLR
jgi:hypothetical protein